MAEAHYEVSVPAPIDVLWAFCADPANWVDLLRGYQSHEVIDDRRSSWTLQVDVGPFSRVVIAEAAVIELVEGERVKLAINGSDATPFSGEAEVHANEDDGVTSVALDVFLTPLGPTGRMVNAVAGPILPRVVEEFGQGLLKRIGTGEEDAVVPTAEQGKAG